MLDHCAAVSLCCFEFALCKFYFCSCSTFSSSFMEELSDLLIGSASNQLNIVYSHLLADSLFLTLKWYCGCRQRNCFQLGFLPSLGIQHWLSCFYAPKLF